MLAGGFRWWPRRCPTRWPWSNRSTTTRRGKRRYRQVSFRQLDDDSERIARGLHAIGVTPGTRLALLVRPGIDFISLVFGLFKSGAVAILIDPGMGRRNLIGCLAEAEPEGFIAIPPPKRFAGSCGGDFQRPAST